MQWIETKVALTAPCTEMLLDLVANCFLDLGLKGVVIEDPQPLEPEADWIGDVPQGPTECAVIGFFKNDDTYIENCRQLEISVEKALKSFDQTSAQISHRRIDEEDWSHSWKAYFHPLPIGERLVIKPTWCEYAASEDRKVLAMDPGMAFGTGTHPSTVMCMEMVEKLLQPGHAFLDVGTGTGLLLIAAALLGAAQGHGIDLDPMAVTNARQNLALNGIDPAMFTVSQGDLVTTLSKDSTHYDLIVANILANAIKSLMPDLEGLLAPRGHFIASGLLVSDEVEIAKTMKQFRFVVTTRLQQEEWLCLAAQKVE